jgi:hypothetical protein
MRTSKFLLILGGLFIGCSSENLSKEEATNQIRKEYPHVVDVYIYTGDPEEAKRLNAAGLETDGYVTIKKTKGLSDNFPWISFTEKAKPYLLATDAKDKENLTQRVKAASEEFIEVMEINQDDKNKTAEITFQTKITEITPFGKLTKLKDNDMKTRKANFIKDNGGWHLKARQEN